MDARAKLSADSGVPLIQDAAHAHGAEWAGKATWVRAKGVPDLGGWFTRGVLSNGGALVDLGWHPLDAVGPSLGPVAHYTRVLGSVSADFLGQSHATSWRGADARAGGRRATSRTPRAASAHLRRRLRRPPRELGPARGVRHHDRTRGGQRGAPLAAPHLRLQPEPRRGAPARPPPAPPRARKAGAGPRGCGVDALFAQSVAHRSLVVRRGHGLPAVAGQPRRLHDRRVRERVRLGRVHGHRQVDPLLLGGVPAAGGRA
ncbi:hypothetical protein STTU_1423 [Streptomyces sp. Tu6071]|nr:hypothetical protein STTU_1423 [Streptomyces sp. Tu6071]